MFKIIGPNRTSSVFLNYNDLKCIAVNITCLLFISYEITSYNFPKNSFDFDSSLI